jgi:hypothetical protein
MAACHNSLARDEGFACITPCLDTFIANCSSSEIPQRLTLKRARNGALAALRVGEIAFESNHRILSQFSPLHGSATVVIDIKHHCLGVRGQVATRLHLDFAQAVETRLLSFRALWEVSDFTRHASDL